MNRSHDHLLPLIAANGQRLLIAVVIVFTLGVAVGLARKIIAALLAAGGRQPRAALLALGLLAVAVTGLWAWHSLTAPKIVERTVTRAQTLAAWVPWLSAKDGDRAELDRLQKQIDTLHEEGVARETAGHFDYRRYQSHGDDPFGLIYYHRNCSVCDQNYRAREKIAAIDQRHPGLLSGLSIPEPPARSAEEIAKEEAGNRRLITAFGETKTLADWAKDPICRVDAQELLRRIEEGWEPRKAIDLPSAIVPNSYGGFTFNEYSEAAQYGKEVTRKREAAKEAELERRRRLPDNPAEPDGPDSIASRDGMEAQKRIRGASPQERERAIGGEWYVAGIGQGLHPLQADRFAQEVGRKYAGENLGGVSLDEQIRTLKAALAASPAYTETEKRQLGEVIDSMAPVTAKALEGDGEN